MQAGGGKFYTGWMQNLQAFEQGVEMRGCTDREKVVLLTVPWLGAATPAGFPRTNENPGKDFTRKRTLTPAVLIYLILTMDEKSVWKGLLGHFQKRIDTPSASAFVQQRQKLLPSAFENLFHRFSDFLRPQKKFQGHRLLAVDGSSLKSGAYPADSEAYRPGTEHRHGWNLFHINALYDHTEPFPQKRTQKVE